MRKLNVRKKTDLIVIHCADTYPDMDIGVKEIDRWHRARGFLMVGYHFVIRRDGSVETGRHVDEAGAHVAGANHRSVGICVVGGKSRDNDGPENNFTEAQWNTLSLVVGEMLAKYPTAKVVGHNELNKGKACPTFDVQQWLTARS